MHNKNRVRIKNKRNKRELAILNNDLKKIPKHLVKLLGKHQIAIEIINKNSRCYTDDYMFSDGKLYKECSHYNAERKTIYINLRDVKEYAECQYFSVIIHEIAHAIDNVLGCELYNEECYFTSNESGLKRQWKLRKGLDFYANKNEKEYFAQGFMAYFQKYDRAYIPKVYSEHNKRDLKIRDGLLYKYVDSIVNPIKYMKGRWKNNI